MLSQRTSAILVYSILSISNLDNTTTVDNLMIKPLWIDIISYHLNLELIIWTSYHLYILGDLITNDKRAISFVT